ncbi:MAG: O-antigen ligase family protein [Lentisphaeria bacterium]|nr:O-antigen ligase family protein [Lentisphaeria bacterium]
MSEIPIKTSLTPIFLCMGILVAVIPAYFQSNYLFSASHFMYYMIALICFGLTFYIHINAIPESKKNFTLIVFVSILFLSAHAIYQRHIGYPQTIAWLESQPNPNTKIIYMLKLGRVQSFFSITNSLAGFLIFMFPVMLGLALTVKGNKSGRILTALFSFSICGLALWYTKSRAAFVCLIVSIAITIVVIAMMRGKVLLKKKKILIALCISSITGIVVVVFLYRILEGNRDSLSSLTARFDYWLSAWHMFINSPVFGAGLGNFSFEHTQLKAPGVEEARLPHSTFYFFLSQAGLPATSLAIALMISPIFYLKRIFKGQLSSDNSIQIIALFTGANAMIMHSLVDLNFQVPATMLFFLLMPICIPDNDNNKLKTKPFPALKWLAIIFCILGLTNARWIPREIAYKEFQLTLEDPKSDNEDIFRGLEKNLKLDPSNPYPISQASKYFKFKRQYNEAIRILNYAQKATPKHASTYRNLAELYLLNNQLPEALKALETSLQIYPHDPKSIKIYHKVLDAYRLKGERVPLLELSIPFEDQ